MTKEKDINQTCPLLKHPKIYFITCMAIFGIATYCISLYGSFSSSTKDCDFIQHNQCYSCDEPLAFSVGSPQSCAYLCPNRTVNTEGSGSAWTAYNCALKECPKDRPYAAQNGSCFATQEEAENNSFDYNTDNTYVPDADDNTPRIIAQDGKCPEDKPLLSYNACYDCQAKGGLSISAEECAKCSNRIYKTYPKMRASYCELECPPDKPLKNWDEECYSCDEKLIVRLDTHCNIEEDCEDICPNRTILYGIGGNVPSIPNCPADKPLMDREGICYPCDAPIAIGLEFNERLCTQACPTQREMIDGYCQLINK